MTETRKVFSVYNIVLIAIFVALITVCSWIPIPIGPIPFTLQTFAIFVTGGLLGARRGTIAVIVYILIGIIGVPVFSGFGSGIAKFIPHTETGMTGGYIVGFVFTTLIIGLFKYLSKDKIDKKIKILYLAIGMLLGDIVCFVFGTIWFWQFNTIHADLMKSISLCVLPFIIPDIVKMIVALIVVERVENTGIIK